MAMTPEEYAARELHVPGWDQDKPVYVPTPPGIPAELLGHAAPATPPTPPNVPVQQMPEGIPDEATIRAMNFEHNFTLPLQQRRLEGIAEAYKIAHLGARTRFWKILSFSVVMTPVLIFVALLVK